MSYPKQLAPTCLIGFISSQRRYESIEGDQAIVDGKKWVFNEKPESKGGSLWFLSNLQKQSRFGFLLQWPLCWHHWIMPKKQKKDANGGWIPESEYGWYFRIGWWRYDVPGTKVNGVLRHWMGPFSSHPLGKWD